MSNSSVQSPVHRRAASPAWHRPPWPVVWLLLPAPGVARLFAALTSKETFGASDALAWLAPGLLPLVFLAWIHRGGAAPALARLRKEAWQPTLVAAVVAALLTPPAAGATGFLLGFREPVAMFLLPVFGIAAFVESEYGTQAQWLAQPLPRWRLYAEKGAMTALFAGAAVTQLITCTGVPFSPASLVLGLAAALGVAPVLALTERDAINALLISLFLAVLGYWLTLTDDFRDVLSEAFRLPVLHHVVLPDAGVALACVVLLVGPWALFVARGEAAALPELSHRRWWAVTGRTAAWTLARKELRLQLEPFAVAALTVGLWVGLLFLRPDRPEVATVGVGFFGLMGALLAGAVAVTSEHTFGTFAAEYAVVPSRTAWRMKVAVSAAVAVLVGLVVPALLTWLTPGLLSLREELTVGGSWANPETMTNRNVAKALVSWLGLCGVAWSAGLFASTLARRLTVAFLAALAVLGAAVGALALGLSVGFQFVTQLVDVAMPGEVASAARMISWLEAISPWVGALGAAVFLTVPTLVLVRRAAASWVSGRVTVRGEVSLLLALFVAGVAGGLALL